MACFNGGYCSSSKIDGRSIIEDKAEKRASNGRKSVRRQWFQQNDLHEARSGQSLKCFALQLLHIMTSVSVRPH